MLYRIVRFLLRVYMGIFYRLEVQGASNVPDRGGAIVISNHTSWLDPVVMGVGLRRQVFFMAKEELFSYPVFGSVLHGVGAFPVRRGRPDRKALRRALEVLKEGHLLGMFPEGTRSRDGTLRPFEPGVALLAIKAGVPVVPVAIEGYQKFRPVRARVLEPVDLSAHSDGRASVRKLVRASEEIRRPLAAALGQDPGVKEGTA